MCDLKPDVLFAEQFTFHETLPFFHTFDDPTARVRAMQLSRVTRRDSNEAMTYYIDRIWSPTAFGILFPHSMIESMKLLPRNPSSVNH